MTASAVPRATVARPPVLQMVMVRAAASPISSSARSAPYSPMETDARSSSSRMRWASSSTLSKPWDTSAAVRSTILARLTAVGRAARKAEIASSSARPSVPCRCNRQGHPVGARHPDLRGRPAPTGAGSPPPG